MNASRQEFRWSTFRYERLVTLINEFGELNARTADVPRAQREAVLDELARYARNHFLDEEALMRAAGVDPRFATAHSYEHPRFLREVGQMCASNFLAAPETSRVSLRFLLHWLAFHFWEPTCSSRGRWNAGVGVPRGRAPLEAARGASSGSVRGGR